MNQRTVREILLTHTKHLDVFVNNCLLKSGLFRQDEIDRNGSEVRTLAENCERHSSYVIKDVPHAASWVISRKFRIQKGLARLRTSADWQKWREQR